MSNPNHQIIWLRSKPEFAIHYVRSTSTNRGYHETWFCVESYRALNAEDFKRLSECHLLGFGQAYNIEKEEQLIDEVPAVTLDKFTGEKVDVAPVNYFGDPITKLVKYPYWRYTVKRICDSGD